MWMYGVGECPELVFEAHDGLRFDAVQHLQRDAGRKLAILRLVDGTHASTTDQPADRKPAVSENCAFGECRNRGIALRRIRDVDRCAEQRIEGICLLGGQRVQLQRKPPLLDRGYLVSPSW